MHVQNTKAVVKAVKPGKEDDNMVSEVTLQFLTQARDTRPLFSDPNFIDQFFDTDGLDTRIEEIYPIRYKALVTPLRFKILTGEQWHTWEPAHIKKGMTITPVTGSFVDITCTVVLYPTRQQAGMLDELVKEHIQFEIEEINMSLLGAA